MAGVRGLCERHEGSLVFASTARSLNGEVVPIGARLSTALHGSLGERKGVVLGRVSTDRKPPVVGVSPRARRWVIWFCEHVFFVCLFF